MSIKLNDIRDLRINWSGDYVGSNAGSIHFESGDRRFHIWFRADKGVPVEQIDEVSFRTDSVLHSNPIVSTQGYGRSQHRALDFNAATYRALRDLIVLRIKREYGDLDSAVRAAAEAYVVDRDAKAQQQIADLAANIRTALNERKADLPTPMYEYLIDQGDDELIALRGVMYSAKQPDARGYDGNGTVKL